MRIEITETAYTGESEAVDKLTADLHTRGFSTYMDDFGTGQSTLAMLKNVNVDVIKLDRTFVPTDRDQGRSAQIVSSMLEMAQSLHLPIVIEGVETMSRRHATPHGRPLRSGLPLLLPHAGEEF